MKHGVETLALHGKFANLQKTEEAKRFRAALNMRRSCCFKGALSSLLSIWMGPLYVLDSPDGQSQHGVLYSRELCKSEALPHKPDGFGLQRQAKVGDKRLPGWQE